MDGASAVGGPDDGTIIGAREPDGEGEDGRGHAVEATGERSVRRAQGVGGVVLDGDRGAAGETAARCCGNGSVWTWKQQAETDSDHKH